MRATMGRRRHLKASQTHLENDLSIKTPTSSHGTYSIHWYYAALPVLLGNISLNGQMNDKRSKLRYRLTTAFEPFKRHDDGATVQRGLR